MMVLVRAESVVPGLLRSPMIGHLHGDDVILPANLVTVGIRVHPVHVASVRRGRLVSSWKSTWLRYKETLSLSLSLSLFLIDSRALLTCLTTRGLILPGRFLHGEGNGGLGVFRYLEPNFLSVGVDDTLLIRRTLLLGSRVRDLHVMLLRLVGMFVLVTACLSLLVLLASLLMETLLVKISGDRVGIGRFRVNLGDSFGNVTSSGNRSHVSSSRNDALRASARLILRAGNLRGAVVRMMTLPFHLDLLLHQRLFHRVLDKPTC